MTMGLYKVIITETRKITKYVHSDYDFTALTDVRVDYNAGKIQTTDNDVIDVQIRLGDDDDEKH
jgi:hypothetical protein